MKKAPVAAMRIEKKTHTIEGMRVGKIVGFDESGLLLVDFPGNGSGPVAARTTTSSNAKTHCKGNPAGREVLLTFENNDPKLAIIIDTMYSLIDEITAQTPTLLEVDHPQEVTIDGNRISFEAKNEIVLKCGKASITLTSAGKVLINGDYVLSHSSGENRIMGGSVSIN